MSDHLEEQSMEIEAMQAVFMDEFELISTDPGTYKIKIVPVLGGENFVGISMVIRYTPTYPDDVPNVCFVDAVNIPDDDIVSLTQMIYEKAPDYVGMAMVYNLTEIVKDWLLDRNIPFVEEGSMYEEMMKRNQKVKEIEDAAAEKHAEALAKLERIEKPKHWGTTVTEQSFAIWKQKFDEEMKINEIVISDKPTGRELFEKNGKTILANEDEILDKADQDSDEEGEEEGEGEDEEEEMEEEMEEEENEESQN